MKISEKINMYKILYKHADKYKDKENPPVPVKKIKKYLELEGVLMKMMTNS